MTTTDITAWLDFVELENHEEIYCIYRSVSNVNDWGAFSCKKKQNSKENMYFLKCDYCDDTLILASEKAKNYLLKYLADNYIKSDLDIEGWYYMNRAMGKNN